MIEVWPHTPVVQAMRARLKDPEQQEVWRKRGQIKQHDGFRRGTVRGLEGVRTQWSMICATLNLRVLYRKWKKNNAPHRPGTAGILDPLARQALQALQWSQ